MRRPRRFRFLFQSAAPLRFPDECRVIAGRQKVQLVLKRVPERICGASFPVRLATARCPTPIPSNDRTSSSASTSSPATCKTNRSPIAICPSVIIRSEPLPDETSIGHSPFQPSAVESKPLTHPPARMAIPDICQTTVRRSGSRAAIPRQLHSPSRHFQSPAGRSGEWENPLPLVRLGAQEQKADHRALRGGVPATLLPACAAARIRPHPALWISGQSSASTDASTLPAVADRVLSGVGRLPTRCRSRCSRYREVPSMWGRHGDRERFSVTHEYVRPLLGVRLHHESDDDNSESLRVATPLPSVSPQVPGGGGSARPSVDQEACYSGTCRISALQTPELRSRTPLPHRKPAQRTFKSHRARVCRQLERLPSCGCIESDPASAVRPSSSSPAASLRDPTRRLEVARYVLLGRPRSAMVPQLTASRLRQQPATLLGPSPGLIPLIECGKGCLGRFG